MNSVSRIDVIGQNGNDGLHYNTDADSYIDHEGRMIDLLEYQHWTKSTAIYPEEQADVYLALGLASEAGEVAGKLKKFIRDGSMDNEAFISELGDVLWYLTRLCDEFGINIHELAYSNYKKLNDRKNRNKLGGSGDNR